MAAAGKAQAPKLEIDDKQQKQFIEYFNKLEKVCSTCFLNAGRKELPARQDTTARCKEYEWTAALHPLSSPMIDCTLQVDNVLRIFDRKDKFSVHGPDTTVVAKLYGGDGAVEQWGKAPQQLASIGLNRSMFEQLLRHVLIENANRMVELYEGHGVSWRVARRACSVLPACLHAAAIASRHASHF
jgi:hypothetical protein